MKTGQKAVLSAFSIVVIIMIFITLAVLSSTSDATKSKVDQAWVYKVITPNNPSIACGIQVLESDKPKTKKSNYRERALVNTTRVDTLYLEQIASSGHSGYTTRACFMMTPQDTVYYKPYYRDESFRIYDTQHHFIGWMGGFPKNP